MGWLISCSIYSQSELKVFQDWMTPAGTQNFFYKNVTRVDGSGNVYVAGATMNGAGNYDILLAKFNSSGVQQWIQQIDGTAHFQDFATALQLDGSGNVYMTGAITNDTATMYADLFISKYNSGGVLQWTNTYDGYDLPDGGTDIYINTSAGLVYVSGSSYNASVNQDFVAISYNTSGVQQWASRYAHSSGGEDVPVRIEKGRFNEVLISGAVQTGTGTYRWAVVKYHYTSGAYVSSTFSANSTTGIEEVRDMVTDASGNIYLAGFAPSLSDGYDYDVIKMDSNLVIQWERTYDGNGFNDKATAIQVSASGDVYVTGYTRQDTVEKNNYLTLKYNSSGTLIWSRTFNDSLNGDDEAYAMALDNNGKIIITGNAQTEINQMDYYTIKYDTAGTIEWSINYDGDKHLHDRATNVAIDTVGAIIVTGASETASGVYEYATVRYVEKEIINPTDFAGEKTQSSMLYYENKGQLLNTDTIPIPQVRYYTNNSYPQYYFMNDTLSIIFPHIDTIDATSDTLQRIDLKYVNSNDQPKVYPLEQKESYLNYFLAHCPQGVTQTYGNQKLIIPDLYNNIDVVYSSNQNGIKYYFVIKPGGDPSDITIQFTGATSTNINANFLEIRGLLDTLIFDRPLSYQINSSNDTIANSDAYADWRHLSGSIYNFDIPSYDTSKVLIIQIDEGNLPFVTPVASNQSLEWSTFFGGSSIDRFYEIFAQGGDGTSGILLTGLTGSNLFLGQAGTINMPFVNSTDAFVTKFDEYAVNKWTSYIGGTGGEHGLDLATDNFGNIYVVGLTNSNDFVNNSSTGINYSYQGAQDGFVVELNNMGTAILMDSYIGGTNIDEARGIAIGYPNGIKEVYIIGRIRDASGFTLQSSGNYNQGGKGGYDAFIMKLDATNNNQWSTLFGGSGNESFNDIALRPSNGNPVLVGSTSTTAKALSYCVVPGLTDFGLPFCDNSTAYYSQNHGGSVDDIIVEFDRTNQSLIWSTFFGGAGNQASQLDYTTPSLVFTNDEQLYLYGNTWGNAGPSGFPLLNSTNGGSYYQTWVSSITNRPATYIARFNSNRQQTWTSFIGGDAPVKYGNAICSDGENVYLTGCDRAYSMQASIDYCTTPNLDLFPLCNYSGLNYMEINPTGSLGNRVSIYSFNKNDNLIWSSLFGSSHGGIGFGTTVLNNKLYLAGSTINSNTLWDFNTSITADYFKTTNNNEDAAIARFDIDKIIGVNEDGKLNNPDLLIYPNPSNDYINIKVGNVFKEDYTLHICDALGRSIIIKKYKADEAQLKIDITSLSKGIYFIRFYTKHKILSTKFIKQ